MSLSERPKNPDIHVRRPDFDFAKETPRHWFDANPFVTYVLNALSCSFPGGERFFGDAVRHFLPQIEDQTLRTQVRGFLAQESMHQRQHEAFNRWVTDQGLGAEQMAIEMEETLRRRQRHSSPIHHLAITCALEHYTAMMAECLLNWPAFLELMHPSVRPLWIWHAIEEIEHKSVAFDVYQKVGGGYWRRIFCMLVSTYRIMSITGRYSFLMAWREDTVFTVRGGLRAMWLLVGPFGFLGRTLPEYLRYFRPGFHPWHHDNRALIAQWSAKIGRTTQTKQDISPRTGPDAAAPNKSVENDSQLQYHKYG